MCFSGLLGDGYGLLLQRLASGNASAGAVATVVGSQPPLPFGSTDCQLFDPAQIVFPTDRSVNLTFRLSEHVECTRHAAARIPPDRAG